MKKLLLALAALLACQTAATAQMDGPALWTNQHGSQLRITSVKGGVIRGTFTNRAPEIGCLGIPYPITGTNFGVQVKFTVNFLKCRSVGTWQGNAQGFGMSTPWSLRYISNGATTSGFDFFSRS